MGSNFEVFYEVLLRLYDTYEHIIEAPLGENSEEMSGEEGAKFVGTRLGNQQEQEN